MVMVYGKRPSIIIHTAAQFADAPLSLKHLLILNGGEAESS